MSGETAYPCLKVDVNGTEILPKKFAKINWDETVLDNEIRENIREEEEEKRRLEEEQFEEMYEEYYSDEEEEEEEEEEDEYAESPVPHSVLMEYIKTLGQYGYADMDRLGRLSPEEWDDLAANVGIEPDHEKFLLAALGIKRPKKRVVKYRKRSDYEEEPHGDEDEPSLESELFALALNRRNSTEVSSPLPQSPEDENTEERPSVASLRDRVAARRKEGSFDENQTERKTEGDMKKRLAERKKKAEEQDTHQSYEKGQNVIAMRKAKAEEDRLAHEGEERKSEGGGTSVDMSSSDPKAILRERIAARKQGSDSDMKKSILQRKESDLKKRDRRASSPRLATLKPNNVNTDPPTSGTPPRGRASSRANQSETITVPLDEDGKITKTKTQKRTRAPTPGRSNWDKAEKTEETAPSSSESSRNNSPEKPTTSKPATPKKTSRYSSPFRMRSSTTSSSMKEEKKEKSPRAGMKSMLGRFSKT